MWDWAGDERDAGMFNVGCRCTRCCTMVRASNGRGVDERGRDASGRVGQYGPGSFETVHFLEWSIINSTMNNLSLFIIAEKNLNGVTLVILCNLICQTEVTYNSCHVTSGRKLKFPKRK